MRPEVQKLIDALEAERGESDYRRCRRLVTSYYTIGFDVGDFVFVPRLPSILPSSEKQLAPLADDEIALGVVVYSERPHVCVLLPTGVQEIPKAQVISTAIGLSIETRYDLLIMLDAYLERAEAEQKAVAEAHPDQTATERAVLSQWEVVYRTALPFVGSREQIAGPYASEEEAERHARDIGRFAGVTSVTVRRVPRCRACGDTGFSKPGTGYDSVCDECGGQSASAGE